jgi:hypothetical protein
VARRIAPRVAPANRLERRAKKAPGITELKKTKKTTPAALSKISIQKSAPTRMNTGSTRKSPESAFWLSTNLLTRSRQ